MSDIEDAVFFLDEEMRIRVEDDLAKICMSVKDYYDNIDAIQYDFMDTLTESTVPDTIADNIVLEVHEAITEHCRALYGTDREDELIEMEVKLPKEEVKDED